MYDDRLQLSCYCNCQSHFTPGWVQAAWKEVKDLQILSFLFNKHIKVGAAGVVKFMLKLKVICQFLIKLAFILYSLSTVIYLNNRSNWSFLSPTKVDSTICSGFTGWAYFIMLKIFNVMNMGWSITSVSKIWACLVCVNQEFFGEWTSTGRPISACNNVWSCLIVHVGLQQPLVVSQSGAPSSSVTSAA